MGRLSEELRAKVIKAAGVEEIAGLLKADGQDESLAEKLWKELEAMREQEEKLSPDELESVVGGAIRYRDYMTDGCCATVEPGSDCWGNDGGCAICNIDYYNEPVKVKCPTCNKWCGWYATTDNGKTDWGQCPKCRKIYKVP